MPKLIDLTGRKFGRLTVISRAPNKGRYTMWNCLCVCGSPAVIRASHLSTGATSSCGCIVVQMMTARAIHSMSYTPEHSTWSKLKSRCLNKSSPDYKEYGKRGISVCDRWLRSFQNFFDDMGPKPTPAHSIDRVNNSKGYSPENCRWATPAEQSSNRRNCIYYSIDGVDYCLAHAANYFGIKENTVRSRINTGWTLGDALTIPVGTRRPA